MGECRGEVLFVKQAKEKRRAGETDREVDDEERDGEREGQKQWGMLGHTSGVQPFMASF